MGYIIFIVLALAAGGGVFFIKIPKPKQAAQGGTDLADLDNLDYDYDDYSNSGANEQERGEE